MNACYNCYHDDISKPEGENDYALYDFVVITRNDDNTYSAEFINKKED